MGRLCLISSAMTCTWACPEFVAGVFSDGWDHNGSMNSGSVFDLRPTIWRIYIRMSLTIVKDIAVLMIRIGRTPSDTLEGKLERPIFSFGNKKQNQQDLSWVELPRKFPFPMLVSIHCFWVCQIIFPQWASTNYKNKYSSPWKLKTICDPNLSVRTKYSDSTIDLGYPWICDTCVIIMIISSKPISIPKEKRYIQQKSANQTNPNIKTTSKGKLI